MLVAGLVAGAASPSVAAKPVTEGNYSLHTTYTLQVDGTCTANLTVSLWADAKKPATGWLYATAIGTQPFDAQWRLINPQPADGNTISIDLPAEGEINVGVAPIVNRKVLPAASLAYSADACDV